MVDIMKKEMQRFEHLIGFKGTFDVTSNESMKSLINALGEKYKRDGQSSLRLHRLEFFYELMERRRMRRMHQPRQNQSATSDEVASIRTEDVDVWNDLMTLSRIYYVLEHPRSEGLRWKRRIAKNKNIGKFGDMDLIEWQVVQNFRLQVLEEWAQRRTDARRMAGLSGNELYILDDDERVEVESYSEDSDYSGAEDFATATDDVLDEMELETGECSQAKQSPCYEDGEEEEEKEEDISDLLSKCPEYSVYRDPIFEKMDDSKVAEEWYKLYKMCVEPQKVKSPHIDPTVESDAKEGEAEMQKELIREQWSDVRTRKQKEGSAMKSSGKLEDIAELSEAGEMNENEIGAEDEEVDRGLDLKPSSGIKSEKAAESRDGSEQIDEGSEEGFSLQTGETKDGNHIEDEKARKEQSMEIKDAHQTEETAVESRDGSEQEVENFETRASSQFEDQISSTSEDTLEQTAEENNSKNSSVNTQK